MNRCVLALLSVGCRPSILPDVSVSEAISTVVTVSWSTPEPAQSHIEFGLTEALGRKSRSTYGIEHEAILIGLRADERYHLQAVVGSDRSDLLTVTTGSLPANFPEVTVSGDPDALPGYLMVPLMGTASVLVILDGDGEVVWYHPIGNRHFSHRMWLDRAEDVVTFNGFEMGSGSRITRISLDGTLLQHLDYSDHNHDFLPLPDGDLVMIAYIKRELHGELVSGDGIYRMNMSGETELLWSAWDDFEYIQAQDDQDDLGGWTHANALDHHPEDDAFYLSLRSFDALLKIQASTGELLWTLSGSPGLSDFTFTEGSTPPSHQHQFELISPDRLLIFDNRYDLQEPARVVEYALDMEAMTADEVWSYTHDPTLLVYALGDVDRLEDGSTLIDWSTSGVIQLLSPEDEELWSINTELGYAFGYASLIDDLDATP